MIIKFLAAIGAISLMFLFTAIFGTILALLSELDVEEKYDKDR